MNTVKIMALGGLDENGKNMYVVEINDNIFIIESGLKYPEQGQLGIQLIIPDFTYLKKNRNKIRGIFITHAHDDVMGSLSYLLKEIRLPIFTTAYTAAMIKKQISNEIKDLDIKVVKRDGDYKIANVLIKTFGLTHSVADAFGVAIDSGNGFIVFASEFIVDLDIQIPAFQCDLGVLSSIAKKGVLALMCESSGADHPGYTAPKHRITNFIEPYFQDATGRIFITTYQQNLFRIFEIINLAHKFKRRIVFMDENLLKDLLILEKLGYYK
ncbi:MAG: ribonuclease J, partial [Erysipelotrichaceae bacterium]